MAMTVRDLQIKQSRRMVTNFSCRHTRIRWRKDWDPTESTATRPLAFTDHTAATPATYFYTHDLTKNVCELLSRNGSAVEIVTTYDYTPFGAVIASNSTTANSFMFSSEVLDAEISLIYYNYRHYNPTDGRWISRDPIEEKGGENLYIFNENLIIINLDIIGLYRWGKDNSSIIIEKGDTISSISSNTGIPKKLLIEKNGNSDKIIIGKTIDLTNAEYKITVKFTYYCSCEKCCGKKATDPGYGTCKDGTKVCNGTLAANLKIIPLGATISFKDPTGKEITGTIHDTGGGLKGKHIDIWCADHAEAKQKGTFLAEATVKINKKGK